MREDHLKRKYGVSIEYLEQLLEAQGGCCAICEAPWEECVAPKRSRYEELFMQHLYVDHDHETGKVRGLLCNNCNVAIALFEENPSHIASAIEYLQRTES